MLRRRGIAVSIAFWAATLSGVAAGQEIGVAASVVPRVSGEPPGRPLRSIQIGIDVLRNERIATGPLGRAQMLFRDGSALTVGPDSDVVLDEYVFDPATDSGRMTASIGKGVLRLVGGRISKQYPVVLRTPTATIGIRGGVALYDNGTVTFLFGRLLTIDATAPDGAPRTLELRRPGTAVVIGGDGRIGPPVPADRNAMAGTLASLEGVTGSGGGATETPTDQRIVATQVPALGSINAPATVGPPTAADISTTASVEAVAGAEASTDLRQASQTQGATGQTSDFTGVVFTAVGLRQTPFSSFGLTSATFSISPKDPNNFDRGGTGFVGNNTLFLSFPDGDTRTLGFGSGFFTATGSGAQGSLSGTGFASPGRDFFFYALQEPNGNPAFIAGGMPIQGFAAPASGVSILSHRLYAGFPEQTSIPTLPASLNANLPGAVVSPFYSVLSPGLYAAGTNGLPADTRSQFLWAALAIDGQGAGQRSVFVGTTGRYYVDNNSANATFGHLVAAGAHRGYARLGSQATPGGNGQLVRIEQGSTQLFDANGDGFFGSPEQTYFTLGSDTYSVTPPHRLFDTAGFGQAASDLFFGPTVSFYSAAPALPQAVPAGVGTSRSARTLNGYAAGMIEFSNYTGTTLTGISFLPSVVQGNNPSNLSITTDPTLNRLTASMFLQDSAFNFQYGFQFGDLNGVLNVRSAFVDDDIFAARESELRPNTFFGTPFSLSRNLLISSAVATPTSILPAGVAYCGCRYVKWGFFSIDGNNNTLLDLGTWVAGELPALAAIPASGTATYTGHAFGSVANGVNRYAAVGSYVQSWDFATRTGGATIGSFDGRTLAGGVSSANGREFSGAVSGGGVSGNLAGSFFQGGGDAAAEVGGQFNVTDGMAAGYRAVGTFAARR